MKKSLFFALIAVLAITLASCKQQSIDQDARRFVSARGDYACDLLYDTIDIYALFPEKYFDTDPDDYYEPLCAHNEHQYVLYGGTSELARSYADCYNALVMLHNLNSDSQTSARFGEDDESVYPLIADSIFRLDCSIIRNDTLRQYMQQARDNVAYYVRSKHTKGEKKVEQAFDLAFGFVGNKVNPVIEQSGEAYTACVARTEYFQNFDSVRTKRGTSDISYQQQLLNHLFLAKTPAERHVYALEFAHSDSINAHFLVGAAVLNREFVDNAQYSPYLSEMWLTWRASLSTLIGASSWSYIPNLIYNQKRAQIAQTIILYIENNPTDILAQGILIDLAGNDNISRFGGLFGNAAQRRDKKAIAHLVDYPLHRLYPMKYIRDENEFVEKFDMILSDELLDKLSVKKWQDWGRVGWKGIMYDCGQIWLNYEDSLIRDIHCDTKAYINEMKRLCAMERNILGEKDEHLIPDVCFLAQDSSFVIHIFSDTTRSYCDDDIVLRIIPRDSALIRPSITTRGICKVEGSAHNRCYLAQWGNSIGEIGDSRYGSSPEQEKANLIFGCIIHNVNSTHIDLKTFEQDYSMYDATRIAPVYLQDIAKW